MRAHSAERYVNKKMEKELQQYKVEIENRYKKSALKSYVFPTQPDYDQYKTL